MNSTHEIYEMIRKCTTSTEFMFMSNIKSVVDKLIVLFLFSLSTIKVRVFHVYKNYTLNLSNCSVYSNSTHSIHQNNF